MMVSDTTRLALRNLREAVLRTALTALGVSIGIASLVGMVSFGVALQDQVVGSFTRSGLFDSITVTQAFRAGPLGGRGRGRGRGIDAFRELVGPSKQAPADARLDDEALKKFAALDRVKEVYPDIRVPVQVAYGDASEFAVATGVPISARGRGVFQTITAGQFFRNEAEDACLISLDFAHRLTDGKVENLVGKELKLAYASSGNDAGEQITASVPGMPAIPGGLNIQRTEKTFRIVGILERQAGPNPIAALFSAVMIPLAKAREMGNYDFSSPQALLRGLSEKRTYATVTVKVARAQDAEEMEKKIRDMGYTAFSIADVLQGQKRAFILLDLFLGLIGSIALTVASLGIVNTMVMSILERTREIGIMKAIGGSDEDVRRIFLIEAALIGVMGGVFGLVLGWGVGRAINYGANYYLRGQGVPATNLFLIPWWLIAGGIAFALLVSLIAGSFPAMRASRLDPIQALRHD
jgi:putative ABC transport system permease protein